MSKTPTQLDAEIAEELRAKAWQAQIEREHRERIARNTAHGKGPTPEQFYNERASDLAAGVFHGERRGRAKEFRERDEAKLADPRPLTTRQAELIKLLVEEAGGTVTIAPMSSAGGHHVTIEYKPNRWRETMGVSKYGITGSEACAFSAPKPFERAVKAAISKAKKLK